MSNKNVNVPANVNKPFGAMDEESFKKLVELIEGQYIFVCGTELTIRGTIKELKKMHGVDNPMLSRFKFLVNSELVDNDFVIIKNVEDPLEAILFKGLLEQYKTKEGEWIEIT